MYWNCGSKKIEYGKKVLIMGIVNVTPDSFSDGGKWLERDFAVSHALELIEQGADMIDIGAQSTRPGYTEISPREEWQRLEGVLAKLRPLTDVPISVDTYFPAVGENAVKMGADIINDISGNVSSQMAKIVKTTGCGWILMYSGSGSVTEVKNFFKESTTECEKLGVHKSQLCLDMGIGFNKDYKQNLELIAKISEYKLQGYPLLLGASRKRVIGRASGQDLAQERVYGNIAADTVAILGGVDIIRLHDVKNEKQGICTALELKKQGVKFG